MPSIYFKKSFRIFLSYLKYSLIALTNWLDIDWSQFPLLKFFLSYSFVTKPNSTRTLGNSSDFNTAKPAERRGLFNRGVLDLTLLVRVLANLVDLKRLSINFLWYLTKSLGFLAFLR